MTEQLHPPGVSPGAPFADRVALRAGGVHLALQAGIDYRVGAPAHSIVLNEGYIDDVDDAIEIIYTGHGGNENGRQVADQKWERGNLAMYRAWAAGSTVWVSRGPKLKRTPLPTNGTYVYGGAYRVVDAFREEGRDGFLICRFRMVQIDGIEPDESLVLPDPSPEAVQRIEAVVQRLVRNSQLVREVKAIHANTCQFCGEPIDLPHDTRYSEGAH
ncbi:MAG: hypothetical protein JWM86_1537, partial [Thermoleophilia bacterium]|nr:hypothetical protein [Thermoleophilia bacterium]